MTEPSAPTPPVGVLIAQLGTPAAPEARALRPYLRQFLSDRRVIDLSPWRWWPILHLLVLTRRPARSARLYRRIWTDRGEFDFPVQNPYVGEVRDFVLAVEEDRKPEVDGEEGLRNVDLLLRAIGA